MDSYQQIKPIIMLFGAFCLVGCNGSNSNFDTSSALDDNQLQQYMSLLVKTPARGRGLVVGNGNQLSFSTPGNIQINSIIIKYYSGIGCSGAVVASTTLNGQVTPAAGTYTSTNASNYALCDKYVNGNSSHCSGLYSDVSAATPAIQSMQYTYNLTAGGIGDADTRCLSNASNNPFGHGAFETILDYSENPPVACASGNSCGYSQDYASYDLTVNQDWQSIDLSGGDGHAIIQYNNPQVDANHNVYIADEANFDIYKYNGSSGTIAGTAPKTWYSSYYNLSNSGTGKIFIYAIDPIGDVLASDAAGNGNFYPPNMFNTSEKWHYNGSYLYAAAFDTRSTMTIYSGVGASYPLGASSAPKLSLSNFLFTNSTSISGYGSWNFSNMIFENNPVSNNDFLIMVGANVDINDIPISGYGIYMCDDVGNCNETPLQPLSVPTGNQLTAYLLTRDDSGNVFVYDKSSNNVYVVSPEQLSHSIQTNMVSGTQLTNVLSLAWDSYTNSLIAAGDANGQAEVWSYSLVNNTWTNLNLNMNTTAGVVAGVDGDLGIIYAFDVAGRSAASLQEVRPQ